MKNAATPPVAGKTACARSAERAQETVPCIDSQVLFGQARLIHIEHGGQCYVLRITRENRLILTK